MAELPTFRWWNGIQLTGFGGWLLLLAIVVWLGPFHTIANIYQMTAGVDKVLLAIQLIWQTMLVIVMTMRLSRFVSMFVGFAVLAPVLDTLW